MMTGGEFSGSGFGLLCCSMITGGDTGGSGSGSEPLFILAFIVVLKVNGSRVYCRTILKRWS
jgi:hypothetical protein